MKRVIADLNARRVEIIKYDNIVRVYVANTEFQTFFDLRPAATVDADGTMRYTETLIELAARVEKKRFRVTIEAEDP